MNLKHLWVKKNKLWVWTAVNNRFPGILAWTIGDRSSKTFARLWKIIKCWKCYFYVTDGYPVYSCFIDDCDQIIKKTYMTRVVRAASPLGRRRKYQIKTLRKHAFIAKLFAILKQQKCLSYQFDYYCTTSIMDFYP